MDISSEDIKKFICCFIGCGKTTAVLELAARNLAHGEKCCIVTNLVSPIMQKQMPGIDFIKMKDVLASLKGIEKIGPQHMEMFKGYDRVMIDPACYEELIYYLLKGQQ